MSMTKFKKGLFHVQNPKKYAGTKAPTYRSSYELEVFKFCDRHPNVIKWNAELFVVPYFNPVKQRKARYHVDLYMEFKDKNGVLQKHLIEIKPANQTKKPVRGRKSQKSYETELATWMVNCAKWEAAHKFASERGMQFYVMTENLIFRG